MSLFKPVKNMFFVMSSLDAHCWLNFHALVLLFADFFTISFSKHSFRNTMITIRVANELGPNCLQRLSADEKSHN